MHITKKTEYAILGALYLACQPRERFVNVNEITRHSHLPKDLLLKIFHDMVKSGILQSKAGMSGGFRLKKGPEEISLLDILRLFESSPFINDCMSEQLCGKSANCSLAGMWQQLQGQIDTMLKSVTFKSLVEKARVQSGFVPLGKI